MTFGVDYDDQHLIILNQGPCADFELKDTAWPGAGSGTALTWSISKNVHLVELYWFACYATDTPSTTLRITAHPTQGGYFADGATPAVLDPVSDYGWFGFGEPGGLPCPGNGLGNGGSGDGPQGGEQTQDSEAANTALPLPSITLKLDRKALAWDPENGSPSNIAAASYLIDETRADLEFSGAKSIAKSVPTRSWQDTLGLDRYGKPVRIPDMSRYYTLAFATHEEASAALDLVRSASGVIVASQDMADPVANPDDPMLMGLPPWPDTDVQWYLRNRGLRGLSDPTDLNPPWDWWNVSVSSVPPVGIAHMDVGIAPHEDLNANLIPLTPVQRESLSVHPEEEWCGPHGTEMAGIAAARTANSIGMASVCQRCRILDIEVAQDFDTTITCAKHNANNVNGSEVDNTLAYALDTFTDQLGVVLYEFAVVGQWPAPRFASMFFDAHKRGIVVVAPAGDVKRNTPTVSSVASLPFVVGVGGFTERGRFWGADTVCVPDSIFGTKGSPAGYGTVDISGPACGGSNTTHAAATLQNLYDWTSLQTSGAGAAVAGAVAWAQMMVRYLNVDYYGLTADDYAGLITNAAVEYKEDPVALYGCSSCTRADFGSGMLSLSLLETLLLRIVTDEFHVVTFAYGDPGTSFVPVGEIMQTQSMFGPWYRLWEFRSPPLYVHRHDFSGTWARVAWPVHFRSGFGGPETIAPYFAGPRDNSQSSRSGRGDGGQMDDFVDTDVTSCYLSWWRDTGYTTLSAHAVEVVHPDGSHIGWLRPPEQLVMSAVYFGNVSPAAVDSRQLTESPRLRVENDVAEARIKWVGQIQNELRVAIFDAGGREVWRGSVPAGESVVRWPHVTSAGTRSASGCYFVKAARGKAEAHRTIVVVR